MKRGQFPVESPRVSWYIVHNNSFFGFPMPENKSGITVPGDIYGAEACEELARPKVPAHTA